MTKQQDILNNNNYKSVLDKGFVGLIDHMGNDLAIVQSARVSYGQGTKHISSDRNLIRYLMSHKHWSPFEMCDIKLHIKMPIVVARQLVRHTASLNEISYRYSVVDDDFYVPDIKNILPQSKENNQGRGGYMNENDALMVQDYIKEHSTQSYNLYENLINNDINLFSDQYNGLARELSRMILPVNLYTEMYWSQNLRNMLHLINLRMDSHAQWEIQQYANIIYQILKELFPITIEAFDDYVINSKTLSHMNINLINDIIELSNSHKISFNDSYNNIMRKFESIEKFLQYYKLSKRELSDFENNFIVK